MIGFLLSRKFLIAAGSVTTVTLTGAGGWLSGFGAHQPPAPQIHVTIPTPTATTKRITIIKPVTRTTVTARSGNGGGAPQPPAQPQPRPAPGPGATGTPRPAPSPHPSGCSNQPPGWCRNHHTPHPHPGETRG